MYDCIIIGAGTAGLTASIYATRAGLNVLTLEGVAYGGQIINTLKIENYPGLFQISGYDFSKSLYEQAKELGADIKMEEVTGVELVGEMKRVVTKDNTYMAKTIIIATGRQARKLDASNVDKFEGRGISYCATCDGAFYRNKDVAVIGGGDTALDDAMYLSSIVNKVYVIHRRNEFRGNKNTVEKLKQKDNVEFILDAVVKNINGNELIESIDIEYKDLSSVNLKVDGVFVAIGQVPNTEIFKGQIEMDEMGYIISSDTTTAILGVYVAGDVRTKDVRQLTTAANDGTIAAIRAVEYLQ